MAYWIVTQIANPTVNSAGAGWSDEEHTEDDEDPEDEDESWAHDDPDQEGDEEEDDWQGEDDKDGWDDEVEDYGEDAAAGDEPRGHWAWSVVAPLPELSRLQPLRSKQAEGGPESALSLRQRQEVQKMLSRQKHGRDSPSRAGGPRAGRRRSGRDRPGPGPQGPVPDARPAARAHRHGLPAQGHLGTHGPAHLAPFLVKDCTLDDLHGVLQAVMGWENDHLYQFEARKQCYLPNPEASAGLSGPSV